MPARFEILRPLDEDSASTLFLIRDEKRGQEACLRRFKTKNAQEIEGLTELFNQLAKVLRHDAFRRARPVEPLHAGIIAGIVAQHRVAVRDEPPGLSEACGFASRLRSQPSAHHSDQGETPPAIDRRGRLSSIPSRARHLQPGKHP